MSTESKLRIGDHVRVKPSKSWGSIDCTNEASWVISKGGNPYGIWKITRIFENTGEYEDLPKENIAVLQMISPPIGGWHVPVSRLEPMET